jgi:hypothetical protein
VRAGALPAPLTVIEERTVGPDLGGDVIKMGIYTGIAGFVLVGCSGRALWQMGHDRQLRTAAAPHPDFRCTRNHRGDSPCPALPASSSASASASMPTF